MLQLKRDPYVIGCVALLGSLLLVAVMLGKLTWAEAAAGLGLLLAPSAVGRASEEP